MLYQDLAHGFQYSFRSDLSKALRFFLADTQYWMIEENVSFVTEEFTQVFKGYLQGMALFMKWESIGLELDCFILKQLLQEKEVSLRKRSATLRNRNYFYSLIREVGLKEELPTDFLYLKKRLLELEMLKQENIHRKQRYEVPKRLLITLERSWKKVFGRSLIIPSGITQGKVNELFLRIHQEQCKQVRMEREQAEVVSEDIDRIYK
ncbi:hypothetical protein PVK73_26080 [Bacillus thuringiensis]